MKYGLLITMEDFTQADSVLSLMAEMNEDNGYCNLLALLTDYSLGEGGVFAMVQDLALVDSLETLAEEQNRSGLLARNILWKVMGRYYPMLISDPDEEERIMEKAELQMLSNQSKSSNYQLFPNPTYASVTLSRKDNSTFRLSSLYVQDVSGRVVSRVKLNAEVQSIALDVEGYEPGIYLLNITEINGKQVALKLAIQKN
jgi:hypothetical protein